MISWGGVSYFLFKRDHIGKCSITTIDFEGNEETSERYLKESDLNIYVRYESLRKIWLKVRSKKDKFLWSIMSSRNPYGFNTEALTNPEKFGFKPFSLSKIPDGYTILGLDEKQKRSRMYLPKDYKFPKNQISKAFLKYKVFVAEAYGVAAIGGSLWTPVLSTPVLSIPGECCTATFLEIGCFETENEAKNLIKYIKTKFFRALVGIQKTTQHTGSKAYRFVPMLDFKSNNEINWEQSIPKIDKQLYEMFELSEEEIKFIEEKISEMK
ncbi:hypothetical protein [Mycoplasma amphoriforme]|uniref:Uncharacterized protein n=1 Tax=Mycoplasma amphoriforme A39 TaxID=572419 RepID=A0A292IIR1_9MOLU|nr:unnamed protein product [Mycoplasma amphoriforme A39]